MHCKVKSFLKSMLVNSLRPRQNGRLFADDTFKRIFLNENIRIATKNSLKFVPTGLINNIPALVLIMAWRRPGVKPLSDPMLVRSLTHICVTRPQWVINDFITSSQPGLKNLFTNNPVRYFTTLGNLPKWVFMVSHFHRCKFYYLPVL